MKVSFTWDEWLAQRASVKAITDKITAAPIRRAESSSDSRLKKAFNGERGPAFRNDSRHA